MYGFKNLIWNFRAKVGLMVLFFVLTLVAFGVWIVTAKVLNTEQYVAIAVGLIAGATALSAIFLQIRLTLKRKLEADAVSDILISLKHFAETSATAVVFKNDFVVKPLELPANFWPDKAYEKFDHVAKANIEIRNAFGGLYVALETHEIAIIHLEHYYRYLTLKIEDFIQKIDERNSLILQKSGDPDFDENAYKLVINTAFGGIMEEWATISSYLMDFRKLLQTELLGGIFYRELLPRKPYDGSSILQQIATKERVAEMVDTRNAQYRI